jgi:hypothetical protein
MTSPPTTRSQFGAFVTCAVVGRPAPPGPGSGGGGGGCSLMLPLPYAGEARLELAVFREGRSWGGNSQGRASLSLGASIRLSVLYLTAMIIYVFERVQWRFVHNDRLALG